MVEYSSEAVCAAFSGQRLEPYANRSAGDLDRTLDLYAWNTRMSAAAFETVAHLEVLFRNAIDRELSLHFQERTRGIPWFLSQPPVTAEMTASIDAVRQRLRRENIDNRHQIVAGLSFGFWAGMLGGRYDELWRSALHRAFPRVLHRRDDVLWTEEHAAHLETSSDRNDRKIARIIRSSRQHVWTEGMYQVFLLSQSGDPDHRTLPGPVVNTASGRGSAYVQGQRYTSLHALETAKSTEDL